MLKLICGISPLNGVNEADSHLIGQCSDVFPNKWMKGVFTAEPVKTSVCICLVPPYWAPLLTQYLFPNSYYSPLTVITDPDVSSYSFLLPVDM